MPPPQQHALGDAVLPADLRGALRAAGDLAHRRHLELPAEDPSLAHCPLLLAQAGECTAPTGGVDFHQWFAIWGAVHRLNTLARLRLGPSLQATFPPTRNVLYIMHGA